MESGKPATLLRTLAALHGLPRRELEGGYVKRGLEEAGVSYAVVYEGAVTKVVVKASAA